VFLEGSGGVYLANSVWEVERGGEWLAHSWGSCVDLIMVLGALGGRNLKVRSLASASLLKWQFPDHVIWKLQGYHFTEKYMSQSRITKGTQRSRPNVFSLDYPWYLHVLCIIAHAYVRAAVMKPSPVPERHRKPQIPASHAKHRRFIDHHGDEGPSGVWTPFGCCSRSMYGHPPIAYQQRSIAAGPVGYPPCLGSST